MSKCTELGYTAWLVVKIEALLYHFLLLALELGAEEHCRKSGGCQLVVQRSLQQQYCWRTHRAHGVEFDYWPSPRRGRAWFMAAGASYGLEEGVLQKSLLLLLLQFYVTDNGQSIYGSWSESLFLYPIFFLLIFLSFPSMLQRNPRKVRSCWQSDLSELSFIYCLLRATFPNSSIRVLGVFQTL